MQLATAHSEKVAEKKDSDSSITVEIAGDVEAIRVANITDDQQPGTSREEQIPVCATWTQGYSLQELSRLQQEDDGIGPILAAKVNCIRPDGQTLAALSPKTRHYAVIWDNLVVSTCSSVLYR